MDTFDLVVVSPLRRTLETATLSLAGDLRSDVPVVAIEAIREVAGTLIFGFSVNGSYLIIHASRHQV